MKRLILPFLLPLIMSGCATVGTVAEFSELTIQVAEYRISQAARDGALWLNTESLLERARQRHEAQDYEQALALARQARFESEAARAQIAAQQDARPWQF